MTGLSTSKRNALALGIASCAVLIVLALWAARLTVGFEGAVFELDPDIPVSGIAGSPLASEGEWVSVYFTDPQEEPAWTGGLDEILAADVDQAVLSVEIACYELDLPTVTDALLRAHRRGAQVRVVIDDDHLGLEQPQQLLSAGVPLVSDDRSAAMHDKFVVIDGLITWTGSWNLTETGTYRNQNNAVRIISREMAANYVSEFDEMFQARAFGVTSPSDTPFPELDIHGTEIATLFAPEDGAMERVMEAVAAAQQSIRIMAFSFTDDDLGALVRRRASDGLLVEAVFEAQGAGSEFSEFGLLQEDGLAVWKDGNPALMHHKVILLDGLVVITGSFNFSESAARNNDENLLVIRDRRIAEAYLDEFDRVVARARP